jgi:hypothetical protein
MPLPGGILMDGALARDYSFRPVDGRLELAIAESARMGLLPAARVTRTLAMALDRVAGGPADEARVRALSVGDRQYLVRQLAAPLGRDRLWLTRECDACGHRLDFPIVQSQMPVKPAGAGFPARAIRLERGAARLRAPTGADQERISPLPEAEALRAWIAMLVELVEPEEQANQANQAQPNPGKTLDLSAGEMRQVEAWIEELSPEVSLEAQAACPACGAPVHLEVDPYLCLDTGADRLLEEIHTLAMNYHWGEEAILDLPRERRHHYLKLIDQSRGLMGRGPGA